MENSCVPFVKKNVVKQFEPDVGRLGPGTQGVLQNKPTESLASHRMKIKCEPVAIRAEFTEDMERADTDDWEIWKGKEA